MPLWSGFLALHLSIVTATLKRPLRDSPVAAPPASVVRTRAYVTAATYTLLRPVFPAFRPLPSSHPRPPLAGRSSLLLLISPQIVCLCLLGPIPHRALAPCHRSSEILPPINFCGPISSLAQYVLPSSLLSTPLFILSPSLYLSSTPRWSLFLFSSPTPFTR